MKKIIALSFILILLVNVFGYFISFSIQRYKIKQEVKQLVKQEKRRNTQHFIFTAQQYERLRQYENGNEFSLNGCMYDVVKKEFVNGNIILTAYYDHQETDLLTKFISFFNEESEQHNSKHTLLGFCLLEFILHNTEWQFSPEATTLLLPSYNTTILSVPHTDLVSPPPDLLFC